MKINMGLDATPDEARWFLSAPDIAPIQEALLEHMTAKMRDVLGSMDPEQMWWQWMPVAGADLSSAGADIPGGMNAMRQFWEQAMPTAMTDGESNDK